MENTFTFTARSAKNSAHVATFTLHDDQMDIDIGTSLMAAENTLHSDGTGNDQGIQLKKTGVLVKPAAIWFVQRAMRPIHITDVTAQGSAVDLHVTAWLRARQRRLLPIQLDWDEVDNPEAAQLFVDEVQARRDSVAPISHYPGLLDYWATWLAGAAATSLLLIMILRKLVGKMDTQTKTA